MEEGDEKYPDNIDDGTLDQEGDDIKMSEETTCEVPDVEKDQLIYQLTD